MIPNHFFFRKWFGYFGWNLPLSGAQGLWFCWGVHMIWFRPETCDIFWRFTWRMNVEKCFQEDGDDIFSYFAGCPVFLFCWRVAIRPVFPIHYFSDYLNRPFDGGQNLGTLLTQKQLADVHSPIPSSNLDKTTWMLCKPSLMIYLSQMVVFHSKLWQIYQTVWFVLDPANCSIWQEHLSTRVDLFQKWRYVGERGPPAPIVWCGLSFISPLKLPQDATHAAFLHREHKRL